MHGRRELLLNGRHRQRNDNCRPCFVAAFCMFPFLIIQFPPYNVHHHEFASFPAPLVRRS